MLWVWDGARLAKPGRVDGGIILIAILNANDSH